MKRLLALASCAALAACTSAPSDSVSSHRAPLLAGHVERLLPWGAGRGEVGLEPGAPERLPGGVSAVAVDSQGAVWLLDPLKARALRLPDDPSQPPEAVLPSPPYAEDLCVGPDGAIAFLSPLRASVRVRDANGHDGELRVPEQLEDVVGLRLGASRQVTLFTALQESYRLGSPSVPQTIAAVLHSKREGAAVLADGSSASVRRDAEGRAELIVGGPAEKSVQARIVLPELVRSARVVGAVGSTVCLRTERASPADPRLILRRVVCLDAATRSTLLDQELGSPGLYVPRHELAVGADRLAFIRPQREGLRGHLWTLGGAR
jgi:hypothetical protein